MRNELDIRKTKEFTKLSGELSAYLNQDKKTLESVYTNGVSLKRKIDTAFKPYETLIKDKKKEYTALKSEVIELEKAILEVKNQWKYEIELFRIDWQKNEISEIIEANTKTIVSMTDNGMETFKQVDRDALANDLNYLNTYSIKEKVLIKDIEIYTTNETDLYLFNKTKVLQDDLLKVELDLGAMKANLKTALQNGNKDYLELKETYKKEYGVIISYKGE